MHASPKLSITEYTLDQDLFQATKLDQQPRLRVSQPGRIQVVLGLGSKIEQELHVEPIVEDEIRVSRRRGGGCAVLLTPGCTLVSLCLHAPGFGENRRHFDRISTWLIQGLDALGYPGVYQDGISDLCQADRKVAGACLHRSRDTLYYSVSLLVQLEIERIERYLRHPPREPAYRRNRSHTDFLAALTGQASIQDAQVLGQRLRPVLSASLDSLI